MALISSCVLFVPPQSWLVTTEQFVYRSGPPPTFPPAREAFRPVYFNKLAEPDRFNKQSSLSQSLGLFHQLVDGLR